MNTTTKLVAGVIVAGALLTAPIIPSRITCTSAGDETQFSTSDGFLHVGQWAAAEPGFVWINTGNVRKIPDIFDVSALEEVNVVGMRYWRICNNGTNMVRDTQLSAADYDTLKVAEGIERTTLNSALEALYTPAIAEAAIANDATTSARNSTGTSLTVAFTCTNNNTYLSVGTGVEDSNHANFPITSATYNGNSLSKIRSDEAAGNNRTEAWGYKPTTDCNGASHNVVVNMTGAVGEMQVFVATQTGVDQTSPNDANNGSSGNSSTASDAITTVADNAWILSVVSSEANISSNGTGQTTNSTLTDQSFENGRQSWEGPKTPAGSDTQSFTFGFGASWAITSISLKPAAAAAASTPDTSDLIFFQ